MKGIVAKPMPKHWYNEKAAEESGNPIDIAICASKKPYFMIYRYNDLRSQYLAFLKSADKECVLGTGMRLNDVFSSEALTDAEIDFLHWYERFCPAQHGHGVMNRICAVCEDYFANKQYSDKNVVFNKDILKSGVDYSRRTKDRIAEIYLEYAEQTRKLSSLSPDEEDFANQKLFLKQEFKQRCVEVCPNEEELCDVVIDICYAKERSKQFAWDMCGEQMVRNVLSKNNCEIYWPKQTVKGDIIYDGKRFKLERFDVTEVNRDSRYSFE